MQFFVFLVALSFVNDLLYIYNTFDCLIKQCGLQISAISPLYTTSTVKIDF